MKKLSVLLALILLASMTLGAVAEGAYPIKTDKPVTLTVWMAMDAGTSQVFTNYSESPVYTRFQEVTGVNLEFIHPTYGAVSDGFSLMMAGDKLPDIMVDFGGYYNGGLTAAYDEGVIYDLTPYLEQYAPAYYALINATPETHRQFYDEEGRVLSFCNINAEDNPSGHSVVLRADWCEEFGLNPAELDTFDEIEVYFQKVLDTKPGVVPFLPNVQSAATQEVLFWSCDVVADFYQVDGVVHHYSVEDNYRRLLKKYAEWYQKGYIGVDFASVSNAQSRKLFSAGQVACVTPAIGNAYSDSKTSGTAMVKAPYWTETEGMPVHTYNLGVNKRGGIDTVVTASCDESLLPVVCQFMDFCYTEAGALFSNWGPEGLSWNYGDNNEIVFTDWVLNNEKYETSVMHNVCRMHYWPRLAYADTTCNPNVLRDETVLALRKQYTFMDGWDGSYIIPASVSLTLDENADRNKIMTDIDTFVSESRLGFITGRMNIDTDWDAYVQQIMKYELDDAIQITQNAYDRYVSR